MLLSMYHIYIVYASCVCVHIFIVHSTTLAQRPMPAVEISHHHRLRPAACGARAHACKWNQPPSLFMTSSQLAQKPMPAFGISHHPRLRPAACGARGPCLQLKSNAPFHPNWGQQPADPQTHACRWNQPPLQTEGSSLRSQRPLPAVEINHHPRLRLAACWPRGPCMQLKSTTTPDWGQQPAEPEAHACSWKQPPPQTEASSLRSQRRMPAVEINHHPNLRPAACGARGACLQLKATTTTD